MKLFLLDAYALIYRAYYGFINSPRINSRGENTSAIFGFVTTLEEVLRREQPTHIGVAFDPKGGTFRHREYPPYKAQRQATPEEITRAVPIIKQLLEAYRIPVIEVADFEADDVICTLATQAAAQGIDTYMMTPDKDYGQLVGEHVWQYRPAHGKGEPEVLGVAEICAKHGIVSPEQVIDMLGLMGDSSDNIPGCPGVGPKTAQTLIAQFGSIEGLLAHTDQLKGAVRRKVEDNVEQIRLSRYLAAIRRDAPITLDMALLEAKAADDEALRRMFDELEFRTIIQRKYSALPEVETVATPTMVTEETATAQKPKAKYTLVDTLDAMRHLAARLLRAPLVSVDTETTSTDAMSARLVGLSFAIEEGEAWYGPALDRPSLDLFGAMTETGAPTAAEVLDIFRPVYEREGLLKVGQNIKYDLTVLSRYGVTLAPPMFDTMLAHYLAYPETPHNMDAMARALLDYDTIHIDQLIGPRGKNQRSMADLQPSEICDYAAEDADITLRLYNVLRKHPLVTVPQPEMLDLFAVPQPELFRDIEMPLMQVLARMEMNGVRVDTRALAAAGEAFNARLATLESEVMTLAGKEFNLSSPRQVGEVLFADLHLAEKAKKTKAGQYVTSEEVLQGLVGTHPIVGKILEHRGLKKLMGTYVEALPRLINPATGHIHTSFNQAVTNTGRLSSSNPNLQNIPVRDDDGRLIRSAFIPERGEEWFSADYSQIELRIMAHISGDENLIEAFREGHDIHAATAARIFHKSLDEVTRDERRRAKTANFGIIYGISTFGLAERLQISRGEARELIDNYFLTYPRVKEYMDDSIDRARHQGYAETLYGRRCPLPDITSRNATVRGYAERGAINAPIQGTAADIMKLAMVRVSDRIRREGLRAKMTLQVHDELNFSVPPAEHDVLQRVVLEEMQSVAELRVPLIADAGWGANWREAH